MVTDRDLLIGLEEIADYVNRCRHTVARWVRTLDFPARKIGGVYEASKREIDAWKGMQTQPTEWKR